MERIWRSFQLCLLLGCLLKVHAYEEPGHAALPDFDRRRELALPAAAGPGAARRAAAVQRLRETIPGLRIEIDPSRRSVRGVGSVEQLLTPRPDPGGEGGGGGGEGAGHRVVRGFLEQQADLFGHGAAVLDDAELSRDYEAAGLRTVVWGQQFEGIPVFEGSVVAHLTGEQELISLSSLVVPDPHGAAQAGNPDWAALKQEPPISMREAVVLAARELEEAVEAEAVKEVSPGKFLAGHLPGQVEVRWVWLPMSDRAMRLTWEVHLFRPAGRELYRLLIDADTGRVWVRHRRTFYLSEATYRVFTKESPGPMTPGLLVPSTNQAPIVERKLVTLAALSTNASPTGWIPDGANETRGNNVVAQLDVDGNDEPDLPRPEGEPFRVFDFPVDLSQPPSTYGKAAVVQLFYWCNWMHDRLYELGFTEAAGNLQKDNFGRGGYGGDPVVADAQDGSGVNNANYTPAPDGVSPRIQMFVFDGPDPDRDGDLDGEIILHEYTHGLTDRSVGGGAGIYELQSFGLAEGWSDFFAMALLSEPEDDLDGPYPVGAYTIWQLLGLKQNYYFGIRRYPYSTNPRINPLTYKDIDPAQALRHDGVPINPLRPFDPLAADQVHRQGEIWCLALWEVRANLIRKHGFQTGNQLVLQLVTDGLRLTPPNPTFLQARDGILQADLVRTRGANHQEIWAGFATRGMGVSATGVANWTTTGVREAFDRPDQLTVLPVGQLVFSGIVGGPVLPLCRAFSLGNTGSNRVDWAVGSVPSWLELTPTSGSLAAGESAEVATCLSGLAGELSVGVGPVNLIFTNLTSGAVVPRQVQLRLSGVLGIPYVEAFESPTLSPAWLLTGNGAHRVGLAGEHEPRSGQAHLLFEGRTPGIAARGEATLMVDLEGYTNVVLRFWAKRLGGLANPPPDEPFVDFAHFDGVAISADGVLWYPVRGFTDSFDFYTPYEVNLDSVVAANGLAYRGDFRIRFNYFGYGAAPSDGLVLDDLTLTGFAPHRFALETPASLREDAGRVVGAGRLRLALPMASNVVVRIDSSQRSELIFPTEVLFPAGSREVTFDLEVVDDDLLNGTRTFELSARANGFVTGRTTVEVTDNETARLTLSLPATVREGDGVITDVARVECDRPPARAIPVSLSSSHPSELRVPSMVVIPPGQIGASIPLTVINDSRLDGTITVVVTARVAGWEEDLDVVQVLDNEVAVVSVSLPSVASEAAGRLVEAGVVQLSGSLETNLVVELASSDPTRIALPSAVVFPAGTTLLRIDVDLLDNSLMEPAQTVWVTASAPGFAPGTTSLRILDDETPPWVYRPFPPDKSTGNNPQVQLAWWLGVPELIVNGDFESGSLNGWQRENLGEGGFFINDGTVDPSGPVGVQAPLAGNFSVISSQDSPGRHVLYQDLTIPLYARTAVLRWSLKVINSAGSYAPDHGFRVELRGINNQVLVKPFSTQAGDPLHIDWQEGHYDLTVYRGQRVRIAFVEEDSLGFLNVQLDNIQVMIGFDGRTSSEVYFGKRPELTAADVIGVTTNSIWALPLLQDDQEYYWRVVTRRGSQRHVGPLWQFDTRGNGPIDHFRFEPLAGSKPYGTSFNVQLRAEDRLGRPVPEFTGRLRIRAERGVESRPTRVLTFLGHVKQFTKYRNTLGGLRLHYTNVVEQSTTETDPAVLQAKLVDQDVFLVVEQPGASEEIMAALGESWAVVLNNFVSGGGVLVVCSYSRFEHQLLVRSGLMNLDKKGALRSVTLNSPRPDHPLLSGLALPLVGLRVAAYASSDQVLLRTTAEDEAVVVLREVGAGRVLLIGSDFFDPRSGLERVLANAVAATRPASVQEVVLDRTHTGYLEQGTWSGGVAVFDVAPDVVLVVEDDAGHLGRSQPFLVGGVDDLAVTSSVRPEQPSVGSDLSLEVTVTNSGPAAQIQLVNRFPAGLSGVSALTDQGACVINPDGSVVNCSLAIDARGVGRVLIVAQALAPGLLTNVVEVAGLAGEVHLANNQSRTILEAVLPSLFIDHSSVAEGDSGLQPMDFRVRLAPASSLPVAVEFVTEDLSAVAGEDYEAASGRVEFAPGQTEQTVTVLVIGDTRHESIETFRVRLLRPQGAKLLDDVGAGAILNDDQTPVLAVADGAVVEGDVGQTTPVALTVSLSLPSESVVRVRYETEDNTAEAGADYLGVSGELVFAAGSTSRVVEVLIQGDDLSEPDERFFLRLFNPVGATLGRSQAAVTISDDDAGRIDRFVWGPLGTQYLHEPFPVRVTALDGFSAVVQDFNQSVRLTGLTAPRTVDAVTGSLLAWEFPLATFYDDSRIQSIYRNEELGRAGRVTALWLNVVTPPGQTMHGFTIRLAHTSLNYFWGAAWVEDDWVTVYAGELLVQDTGWVRLPLDTAFAYDGVHNLLVDFRFDNQHHTSDGFCSSVMTGEPRSVFFRTDSAFGGPGDWNGVGPPQPVLARRVPALRLSVETPVPVIGQGAWENGIWSGEVTVQGAGSGLQLRVDDSDGHEGVSQPFVVEVLNDLAVLIQRSSAEVSQGGTAIYTLYATNTGPAVSTQVRLESLLSGPGEVVGVESDQGSCQVLESTVICQLGDLAGLGSAQVRVTVRALEPGTLTNQVVVSRLEPEPYLTNNTGSARVMVAPPTVHIGSITVQEPDGEVLWIGVPVTLSHPTKQPATVEIFTVDGTATNLTDYVALSNTVVFAAGATNVTVMVGVIGDLSDEVDEDFYLELGAANNLVAGHGGRVTLLDNDPPPVVTLEDWQVYESDEGLKLVEMYARISPPTEKLGWISYKLVEGTATGGTDYLLYDDLLYVVPGFDHYFVFVYLVGDREVENDETLSVHLSDPFNAVLGRESATLTILNDDGLAGILHRFNWQVAAEVIEAGKPVPVTVTATDSTGRRMPNFVGAVSLEGRVGVEDHGVGTGTRSWSFPMGTGHEDTRTTVLYLASELGGSREITGLALDVVNPPAQPLHNWTIRMKQTTRGFVSGGWEADGWTTVYRKTTDVPTNGWIQFMFQSPFSYDGNENLLVDFIVDSDYYTFDGLCRYTPLAQPRTITYQTDSSFGDPRDWKALTPFYSAQLGIPNVRFISGFPMEVRPRAAVDFIQGVWHGKVTIDQAMTNLVLVADDGLGHLGFSSPLTVVWSLDADEDGLPDEWEREFFGSPDAPQAGAWDDPDGDGFSNIAEFRAGTNPVDQRSSLRMVGIGESSGVLVVRFLSVPGRSYQVEWSIDLTEASWSPVGGAVRAQSPLTAVSDPGWTGELGRFYRVRVLP